MEQPTTHRPQTKPQWQAPRMAVVGHVTEIVRTPKGSGSGKKDDNNDQ
jgi:hypothetical protein